MTQLQVELIRAAFLLTGDAQREEQLASETLLDHLSTRRPSPNGLEDAYSSLATLNFPEDDPVADDRRAVLLAMGSRYLEQIENGPEIEAPQYDDETERGRLLTALRDLGPADRLALILRDYDQIGEERVARLLEVTPYNLRARLEPTRQAIRDAARTPGHVSTRTLLDVAAGAAPPPRLWRAIEAPLEERDRQCRQRRRRITWTITTAVGLALAIGAIWLITGFSWLTTDDGEVEAKLTPPTAIPRPTTPPPDPTPSPTPIPDMADLGIPQASVPSGLLIDAWTQTSGSATTEQEQKTASFTYDIESQQLNETTRPIAGQNRIISPDGRRLMIMTRDQSGETTWIEMLDVASGEELWQKHATWSTYIDQFVFADDRLIVLNQDESSNLIAYDVETGEELNSKSGVVEDILPTTPRELLGGSLRPGRSSSGRIFATPSGDKLWLWATTYWGVNGQPGAWGIALTSIDPVDLSVTNAWSTVIVPEEDSRLPLQYRLGGAFWTSDASALLHFDWTSDQIYVQSLTQPEPETLTIPFTTREPSNTFSLDYIRSNSGRYLYVIAPLRREIAVIDLLSLKVDLVAPIDSNGYTLSATDSNLPTAMLLSPDGTRLYVANRWLPAGFTPRDTRGAPITVIDTSTWQVIDQWIIPVQVLSMIPEDHGNVIAAEYTVRESGQFNPDDERGILTLDAETGEVLSRQTEAQLELPDWTDWFNVASHFSLYRTAYGRSPMLTGVEYADAETASSLPRVAIALSPESAVGGLPVQIEAQVLDPRTGASLDGPDPAVRFDFDSFLSVTLSQNDDDVQDVIIVLRRDEDGVYRGTTTLKAGGRWNATVTMFPPGSDPLSVSLPGVVTVINSLPGTNGQHYIMAAEPDPEHPAAKEEVTFTVRVINAESQKRIGKGIDLEGGLPETIHLLLSTGNESGFTTVILHQREHGRYEGVGEFWRPGLWSMRIRYQSLETQRYVYFSGGTISVR